MSNLKKVFVALMVLSLMSIPLVASAGEQMAFGQKFFKKIRSGTARFNTCASITFEPPADGFVVVTASGMALFDSRFSDLTLTLHQKANARGPWVFTLTPGEERSQAFTVRFVFPVSAGVQRTFFLNGASANGPGGRIDVQTGSVTVEFYSSANVQSAAPTSPTQASPSKDLRSNAQ